MPHRIDAATPLLLGSGSPRRRDTLTALRIPFRVATVTVDESARPGETPAAYLERVVADKLAAVAALPDVRGAAGILVADTSVIIDGDILGKPAHKAAACSMLRALSGRDHEVWTRFSIAPVLDPAARRPLLDQDHAASETIRTKVWFRSLEEAEILAYASSGEGLDKAGAYAIQGLGSFAVERIEGSYANVVGLPACEVVIALRRAGLLDDFPIGGGAP